ncbi:MAG: hypothetical protein JWQ55_7091 [Rhodopila sp.]|nr:hypothetical protein [Rhodopila sp.]
MLTQPSPVFDNDCRVSILTLWCATALADADCHKIFAVTPGAVNRMVVAPPPFWPRTMAGSQMA